MFTPNLFTPVINSYLPEPHASLLNGILFGVNLKTTKVFYEQLKIVGLLHLVVLSGMNIAILSAIVATLTNFLGRIISTLITILTIILFVIFVGPQAPIIRAGFMGVLTLVAILYGKKTMALYSLLLSLIFIAIFWPRWLATISLQLSYGATLGMILFSGGQTVRFGALKQEIFSSLKTSLSAQLFTAPIIFIYFKEVSLISPIANLLVSFLTAPLMILGFATAILGKVNFWLGFIPAQICYGLLSYMIFVVEMLSKLPFVYFKFK